MKRTSLRIVAAAVALLWSGAAFAVYQETTTVTVIDQGKPVPGQTVTLTKKERYPQQPARKPRVKLTVRHKTNKDGKIVVGYNESDKRPEIVYDVTLWTSDGRSRTIYDVPLSTLTSGGPLDFTNVPPTGQNVTQTTPPPSQNYQPWSGFYVGLNGSADFVDRFIRERDAFTRMTTNRLGDTDTFAGVGGQVGFDWGGFFGLPGFTLGPYGSLTYIDQSLNHVFQGGTFIGTRDKWIADLGGKAGYWVSPNRAQVYVVGGVELLNYDFQSNFLGPVIAINHTATGYFAGLGIEATRPEWHWAGGQWTVFAQGTYSWYCGEEFRMPVFSPGFNYSLHSEQLRAMAGINFHPFMAPPPPP